MAVSEVGEGGGYQHHHIIHAAVNIKHCRGKSFGFLCRPDVCRAAVVVTCCSGCPVCLVFQSCLDGFSLLRQQHKNQKNPKTPVA